MRKSDVDLVRDVLWRTSRGDDTLSRADYVSLLILVRDVAPGGSMLKDLSHSIAHDDRNKGYAYEYLERVVRQLRMAILYNKPFELEVLFPIEQITRELNAVLATLGIAGHLEAEDEGLRKRLAAGIASAVAGTTFQLRHARAHLRVSPDGEYLVIVYMDRLPVGLENLEGFAIPWLIARPE